MTWNWAEAVQSIRRKRCMHNSTHTRARELSPQRAGRSRTQGQKQQVDFLWSSHMTTWGLPGNDTLSRKRLCQLCSDPHTHVHALTVCLCMYPWESHMFLGNRCPWFGSSRPMLMSLSSLISARSSGQERLLASSSATIYPSPARSRNRKLVNRNMTELKLK